MSAAERRLQQHVAYLLEQAVDILDQLPVSLESVRARVKIREATAFVARRIVNLSGPQQPGTVPTLEPIVAGDTPRAGPVHSSPGRRSFFGEAPTETKAS